MKQHKYTFMLTGLEIDVEYETLNLSSGGQKKRDCEMNKGIYSVI